MPTLPISGGIHVCELPPLPGAYSHGDVIRCESCRRYWWAWMPQHFEWAGDWAPLGRFAGWRIARRSRKGR